MRLWSFSICVASLLSLLMVCAAFVIYPCWLFMTIIVSLAVIASAAMIVSTAFWLYDLVKDPRA